jgi:hypothetical protein
VRPFAVLLLLVLVSFPKAAVTQQAAAQAETVAPRQPGPIERRSFPELQRRLDAFRLRRLQQALGVDSAKADAIEAELRRFRDRQFALRRERTQLLEELQRSLDAGAADEATLERRLEALRKNQEARERDLSDLRARLARDLTLEQQAKLQLFAERFQSRLAQGLREIQERRSVYPDGRAEPRDLPDSGDTADGGRPSR